MDFFKGLFNALAATIVTFLVIMFLLSLVSCRTKYVTIPEYHDRYVTRTDTLRTHTRDSVYVHDSVYVLQYTQNDTVYITRDRVRYHYVATAHDSVRILRDTVVVRDSVHVVQGHNTPTTGKVIKDCFVTLIIAGCVGMFLWMMAKIG